jgi:hypothetical protein
VLDGLALRQPVVAPLLAAVGLALAVPALTAVLPARLPRPASRHVGTMAVGALAHFSFFGA